MFSYNECSLQNNLDHFARNRAYILGKLDRMRLEIDVELEILLNEGDVPATTVARLEGLLTARRDALTELANLDDEFMNEMVRMLQDQSTNGENGH